MLRTVSAHLLCASSDLLGQGEKKNAKESMHHFLTASASPNPRIKAQAHK